MKQISFVGNGNISPCPWTDECLNYSYGCQGHSYWCQRFDSKEDRETMRKAKETLLGLRNLSQT